MEMLKIDRHFQNLFGPNSSGRNSWVNHSLITPRIIYSIKDYLQQLLLLNVCFNYILQIIWTHLYDVSSAWQRHSICCQKLLKRTKCDCQKLLKRTKCDCQSHQKHQCSETPPLPIYNRTYSRSCIQILRPGQTRIWSQSSHWKKNST